MNDSPKNDGIEIEEEEKIDPKLLEKQELDSLKSRAKMMGIKHHPSIGLAKLREKVNAAAKGESKKNIQEALNEAAKEHEEVSAPVVTESAPHQETKGERRVRLHKEASRLVRVRVTNMNPNKKEWEGDVYTVSNSVVGTFKKYLPYDNENGWHIPNIIYQHLKERQCQVFYTVKNSRGAKIRKGKLIKELAIEVMTSLSFDELKSLADQQAQRHSLD